MSTFETVITRGVPGSGEFRLLVALGRADNVPQLMRTATDIARFEGGSVHVVSVVHKPYDSEFGVFDDETIRERYAGDRTAVLDRAVDAGAAADVEVTGSVLVAPNIAGAIVEAAETHGADAVLVGWDHPPGQRRVTLGSVVDAVLERVPADVLVERTGVTADGVESVLVPVAGSPHAALAARVASAVAAANDARLVLLAVATPDVDADAAREWVNETETALLTQWGGPDRAAERALAVDGVVVEGTDVADTIVAEASDHDVVLMGATRGGALRRRLVGSIATEVTSRTDRTVLLAQRSTTASPVVRLLGRLRRS